MSITRLVESDKKLVTRLMLENPQARDDDRVLIYDYLTKILQIKFTFFDEYKIKHERAFESLTRARRIVQNDEGQLSSSPEVKQKRLKREVQLREHFIERKQFEPIYDALGSITSYKEIYG